jgi:hypothetical protein
VRTLLQAISFSISCHLNRNPMYAAAAATAYAAISWPLLTHSRRSHIPVEPPILGKPYLTVLAAIEEQGKEP